MALGVLAVLAIFLIGMQTRLGSGGGGAGLLVEGRAVPPREEESGEAAATTEWAAEPCSCGASSAAVASGDRLVDDVEERVRETREKIRELFTSLYSWMQKGASALESTVSQVMQENARGHLAASDSFFEPHLLLGWPTPPNATASASCPPGFMTVRNWDFCYLLSRYSTSRSLAKEHCFSLGSDVELLSIDSSREHYLVTYLIQQSGAAKHADDWWTSGIGQGQMGWAWETRTRLPEVRFTKWGNTTPNQSDKGRCIVLHKNASYFWASDRCSDDHRSFSSLPRHNFICKTPVIYPPRTGRC